jgi:ribosomal protein L27
MTLAEAQAEKQGTYRFNKDAYGRLSGAQVEAEKNLAHTLREQITALFPEINVLNGKDKSLIDLKEQVEKFVVRERRRNMLPAAVAVAGASTGILTGAFSGDAAKGGESGVGAALLTMTMLAMDDPEIKSKLAIALYRAGKNRIGSAVAKTAKEVLPGAARAVGSSVANPSPRGTLTPPPK